MSNCTAQEIEALTKFAQDNYTYSHDIALALIAKIESVNDFKVNL